MLKDYIHSSYRWECQKIISVVNEKKNQVKLFADPHYQVYLYKKVRII